MRKAIVVTALVCLLAMPAMAGINDSHGGKTPGSAGLSSSAVSQADFMNAARPNDSHGGFSVTYSGALSVALSPTLQSLLFIMSQWGLFSSFIL